MLFPITPAGQFCCVRICFDFVLLKLHPDMAAATTTLTADRTTASSGWSSTTAACTLIPPTSSPRMRMFCFFAASLTLLAPSRASGRATIAAERTALGFRSWSRLLKVEAQPAEGTPDYRYLESPLFPSFGEIRPRNQSSILFHLDEGAVAPCSRHFSFCERSNSKAFGRSFYPSSVPPACLMHKCIYIAGTFKPSSRTQ